MEMQTGIFRKENNPSEAPFPRHYESLWISFPNMMPYPFNKVRLAQTATIIYQ
jgi:hypothetical protein